jgi:hypothetical protein
MRPAKEVYDFIEQKILWCLNNLKIAKTSRQILFNGLLRLHYFHLPALTDCCISLSDGENHFTIFYGSDKIEISDSHSVDSGMGFDHFQSFCYEYFFEDDKEYNEGGSMLLEKAEELFRT